MPAKKRIAQQCSCCVHRPWRRTTFPRWEMANTSASNRCWQNCCCFNTRQKGAIESNYSAAKAMKLSNMKQQCKQTGGTQRDTAPIVPARKRSCARGMLMTRLSEQNDGRSVSDWKLSCLHEWRESETRQEKEREREREREEEQSAQT